MSLVDLIPGVAQAKTAIVGVVVVGAAITVGVLYWQLRVAQGEAASEHDRATVEAANADALAAIAASNAAEAASERTAADHAHAMLQAQQIARQTAAKALTAALVTESATNAPLAACLALPVPADILRQLP